MTMAKQDDASARFEQRWKQCMEQPELVEAPPVKLDIDLSPKAVLTRMREVDRAALGQSADEIEGVLSKLRDRFL
jgi:hypothetical protein